MNEDQRGELIRRAKEVRSRAYAPYSNYPVGAAVLCASGRIYEGVNVENAAYPSSICAERAAIFRAVANGEGELLAVAVVTENGGTPCGACRQVIAEFGKNAQIVIANTEGEVLLECELDELLPHSFGKEDLGTGD